MGFETWYQALPDGCELLERAKRDAAFGEFLTFPSRFRKAKDCREPHWQGEDAEFCFELEKLARAAPGLDARNCTLDRYYDKIEFLISPARRNPKSKEFDLGALAVRGTVVLAEHLRGGQGHLLRYNEPAAVLVMAEMLSSISREELRRNYDPAKMAAASVYKSSATAPEEEWSWICEFFDDFSRFYQSAAEHEEGVLVTVT